MTILATIQVDLLATSNISLSGAAQTIDGEAATTGKVVLAQNQATTSDNGPWVVATGAWSRLPEFSSSGEMLYGTMFRVKSGSVDNKGSLWSYTGPDNPTVGTTPGTSNSSLTFQRDTWGPGALAPGGGISRTGRDLTLGGSGVLAGTYVLPIITVSSEGYITYAESGALGSGYIEGLALRYVSATQVELGVGAAYIPGINRLIEVESEITATRLTGGDAAYFAYLYETNGVGQLALSTTAPDEPYFGTARTMLTSQDHRYLGMLRNDNGGNLMPFRYDERLGLFTYLNDYQSVITGIAQTTQTVALGITGTFPQKLVSPGGIYATLKVSTNANSTAWLGNPDYTDIDHVGAGQEVRIPALPLNASQQMTWRNNQASGATNIFLQAYYERR